MKKHQSNQPKYIQIDPTLISFIDLWRSHAYIAYTMSNELVSDIYDVKNPLMLQEILLNLWFDQIYNQNQFSSDLCNWGSQAMRRHGFIPFFYLEGEAYAALS